MIKDNHDNVSQIVHSNTQLVSIVNATRYEIKKNRGAINQLINATFMLKSFVNDVQLKSQMFKGVMLQLDILQDHVIILLEGLMIKC